MRFGAAVAGIKCTRLGGSAGAPTRPEVEALLAKDPLGPPCMERSDAASKP
jgi:hypothetical protein